MKKQLVIIGIVALLVCVGFLSGCTQTPSEPEIETIPISGVGIIQTVNNSEHPIRLLVPGSDCDITVTKATNLTEVILSGVNNTVRVSHSHSFTSTVSGVDTKIVYYD